MATKREITFSQAVQGHERFCLSAGYSPNTIGDYQNTFKIFLNWMGEDRPLRAITQDDVEAFMAWAQETPVAPAGIARRKLRKRRPKTCRNYHTGLSSLWTWAKERGHVDRHMVRQVKPPKVNREPVEPLTDEEVVRLIQATAVNRAWWNKPLTTSARPTAERDRLIICLLVESAIRAEEAVNLHIRDVTFINPGVRIHVDLGKGKKSRVILCGMRLAEAVSDYLLTRPDHQPDDYLLINEMRNRGSQMSRATLGKLVKRVGERAGLKVSPHKLRITGACMMVHNDIGPWSLREVMGHSELTTTMRYVNAAQLDMDKALSASPLDNLRLKR